MNRPTLITGANGFTGSHLARALVRDGVSVRALVRQPDSLPEDLRGRVEVVVGDLRDARAVREAVRGCRVVHHVAALFRSAKVPRHEYWDINVTGTRHVLEAAAAHGVERMVYCSTMGVHGSVTTIPSDERAPLRPGDEYQRTKLAAEQEVWAWYRRTGIPTSVARPAGIYGPGDRRFLKLFRAIQDGRFVMLGDGQTWYHQVFIDDLVRGLRLCETADAAIGESFCFCGDRYITLNRLVELIADILEVPIPTRRVPVWPVYAAAALCEAVCVPMRIQPPLFRRRVDFFTHHRAFTSAKARELLGYEPQVELQDGLRMTAAWYRKQGMLRIADCGLQIADWAKT